MTYQLDVLIRFPKMKDGVTKRFYYEALSVDDVCRQIKAETPEIPDHYLINLKLHKKTAFKDVGGAKHHWRLSQIRHIPASPKKA